MNAEDAGQEGGTVGYVLEIRYSWSSIAIGGLSGTRGPEGSGGFLLTFPTREAAEAWRAQTNYPGATVTALAALSPTLEERDG